MAQCASCPAASRAGDVAAMSKMPALFTRHASGAARASQAAAKARTLSIDDRSSAATSTRGSGLPAAAAAALNDAASSSPRETLRQASTTVCKRGAASARLLL